MAVHGGSLANMIFQKAGSTVVEVNAISETHRTTEDRSCYFSMAKTLGLGYRVIEEGHFNDTLTEEEIRRGKNYYFRTWMTLDIAALKRTLKPLCAV